MALDLPERIDAWVYDCEVFAHDWLFVFKSVGSGSYATFWNDPHGLKEFLGCYGHAIYIGYNSSRYDQYIIKAVMVGCTPEEVKEVNDFIIADNDMQPWEHPYLQGEYYPFNDVDLMKDTQVGTSLKSIEGHAGMSVEESEVDFDWPDKLTDEQRADVEKYCRHDVDATEQLLHMREDYLNTKVSIGNRVGLDPIKALALTNAKLTARMLKARAQPHDDERAYAYPDNLLREWIPDEVFAFFDRMADEAVPDEELWSSKLEIMVGTCPVTIGFGGIHGAIEKWQGPNGGKQLIIADVASYYPSLMINNGYTSRNIPSPQVFEDVYHERLRAKQSGDKATANALKLIVNTTYGATLNSYNDLYDPLMARSVCVSGQLYLLELARHALAECPHATLVNLNTDGLYVEVPKDERNAFLETCEEWQARTGFALEFDYVDKLMQRDVNNYTMVLSDGSVKHKGAVFVRGQAKAGAFSINNNATIVAEAVEARLLHGTPCRKTIEACDDPAKFQLVAKASSKYSRVYQLVNVAQEPGEPVWEELTCQRCNRVFASKDPHWGRLYKVKRGTGQVAKIESLPEQCLISNEGMCNMSEIDKEWYVALAEKRAQEFYPAKEKKVAARTTTKKEETPNYASWNVMRKLIWARRKFIEANPQKTGKNRHLGYKYFTLDDIVPVQTEVFDEVGLLEQISYYEPIGGQIQKILPDGTTTYEQAGPMCVATVINVDNPDDAIQFKVPWTSMRPQLNKDGEIVSDPLQDFGKAETYLRRYVKMLVLDIVEPDLVDEGADEQPAKTKAPSAVKTPVKKTSTTAAKKPVGKAPTQAERAKTAEKIVEGDGKASAMQVRQLRSAGKKLKAEHGEAHPEVAEYLANLSAETGNLKELTKERFDRAINDLGAMREKFESEGAEK